MNRSNFLARKNRRRNLSLSSLLRVTPSSCFSFGFHIFRRRRSSLISCSRCLSCSGSFSSLTTFTSIAPLNTEVDTGTLPSAIKNQMGVSIGGGSQILRSILYTLYISAPSVSALICAFARTYCVRTALYHTYQPVQNQKQDFWSKIGTFLRIL